MERMKRLADRALGSRPVTAGFRRATRHGLRILAYHGVAEPDNFARHMAHLATHYHPVDAAAVVHALHGDEDLPDGAVWVTFDDGHPDVVERALPIMLEHGVTSTMFVCPGLVDTDLPYWWDVVAAAMEAGITCDLDGIRFGISDLAALKSRLKAVPDVRRRQVVAGLEDALAAADMPLPRRRQVTTEQLRRFVASGGTVANHTWDHPCLDRCTDAEVRAQIGKAGDWLAILGPQPRLFAYPNGNHSPTAEALLADLGYAGAVLFDHRLAAVRGNPLQLSRLRVNDHTSLPRFAAIVAAVHPTLHRVRTRLGGRGR